jgi:hypothetical protein
MPPTQQAFLEDLFARRGNPKHGTGQFWLIEKNGGKLIIPTAFEPDPVTCRDNYYYNAATNALYKRIVTRRERGILTAHWQKVSD